MKWFQEHNINVMHWPVRFSDRNPVENLWKMLIRKVYANGRQFDNKKELKDAILNSLDEIGSSELQKLICYMKNRVYEVISNYGKLTKY